MIFLWFCKHLSNVPSHECNPTIQISNQDYLHTMAWNAFVVDACLYDLFWASYDGNDILLLITLIRCFNIIASHAFNKIHRLRTKFICVECNLILIFLAWIIHAQIDSYSCILWYINYVLNLYSTILRRVSMNWC